jgi:hypothetical protein
MSLSVVSPAIPCITWGNCPLPLGRKEFHVKPNKNKKAKVKIKRISPQRPTAIIAKVKAIEETHRAFSDIKELLEEVPHSSNSNLSELKPEENYSNDPFQGSTPPTTNDELIIAKVKAIEETHRAETKELVRSEIESYKMLMKEMINLSLGKPLEDLIQAAIKISQHFTEVRINLLKYLDEFEITLKEDLGVADAPLLMDLDFEEDKMFDMVEDNKTFYNSTLIEETLERMDI